MCGRKFMFGDKITFGSSLNDQNMPKKGQQEKIFLVHLTNYPLFKCKTVSHFIFPLKICTFFKGIRE